MCSACSFVEARRVVTRLHIADLRNNDDRASLRGNDAVRLVGIILALLGSASLTYSVRATLERPRPSDVLFAVLAWLSLVLALLGVALIFVPGFLG
ncbi:MAG: hypothetical protein JKY56_19080 [Kofleriaceae bacterium]|nr:hypothetical protein [Kofleriaceae bacterium]